MLGYIWQYVYTSFLRYWLKWFIRQATGTCELQRICSGYKPGATRTTKAGELNTPKSGLLFLLIFSHYINLPLVFYCRIFSPVIKEQGKKMLTLLTINFFVGNGLWDSFVSDTQDCFWAISSVSFSSCGLRIAFNMTCFYYIMLKFLYIAVEHMIALAHTGWPTAKWSVTIMIIY